MPTVRSEIRHSILGLDDMAFEGAVSSLGACRGLDGSIDRVPDPPQELWKVLAFLQAKCDIETIEIISVFEVRASCNARPCKRTK